MPSFSTTTAIRVALFALLLATICSYQAAPTLVAAEETQTAINQWRAIGPFRLILAERVYSLALSPNDTSVIYAGTNTGVFKTSNGGTSWQRAGEGLPYEANVTAVAVSPSNSNIIYAAARDIGVYKSSNGGTTWTRTAQLTPALASVSAGELKLAVSNAAAEKLYVSSSYHGIFKSVNGGTTWEQIYQRTQVNALALHPSNDNLLLANIDSTVVNPGQPNGTIRTVNGGLNWTISDTAYPVTALAFAPSEPNRVYLFYANNRLFSTDAGATWTRNTLTSRFGASLAVAPSNPQILYSGSPTGVSFGGGVFKSTDGGLNFTNVNGDYLNDITSYPAFAIHPANPNLVYAGSLGRSISKTSDGGSTWQPLGAVNGLVQPGLESGSVLSYGTSYRFPNTLYATVEQLQTVSEAVYKSTDNGATWTRANSSSLPPLRNLPASYTVQAVTPDNPAGVFVRRFVQSSINDSIRTPNGGANWTNIDIARGRGIHPSKVFISNINPNLMFAEIGKTDPSGGDLMRSTDGGQTWSGVAFTVFDRSLSKFVGFSATEANTLFLFNGSTDNPNQPAGFYLSPDGGTTRTLINTTGNPGARWESTPINGSVFYSIFTSTGSITKSTDGGQTWTNTTALPDNANPRELVVSPLNANVVYVATDKGVYKTSNGGIAWQGLHTPFAVIGNNLTLDASGTTLRLFAAGTIHEYREQDVAGCVPPVVTLGPGQVTLCEGSAWTITATVSDGTPPFAYVWRKDGVVIPGATSSSISGTAATTDAGQYSVTVSNSCGSSTTPSPGPGIVRVNVLTGVEPPTASYSASGGRGSFSSNDYNSQDDRKCSRLSASSATTWLRVESETRLGYNYVVDPNPATTARTGTFTVSSASGRTTTHTVTQAGTNSTDTDVVWANLINTTVSGNILRKTAGFNDGTWDGSALSQQSIVTGNGHFEFTATGPNVYRAAGLNGAGALSNENSIDHAIVFTNSNIVEFRESGQYRGDATFAVGDVFRIAIESGRAAFYKNGALLVRGTVAPVYPLKATAVFSRLNGEISQAKFVNDGGNPCTYSISPTSESIPSANFTSTISVSTQPGCAWTATSNLSWITINLGASGTGNGVVNYTAAANTGVARTGTLTVARQTFTLTQAAASAGGNNITWVNLVNTTLSGNTLRKTAGFNDGTWDGRALSQQTIAAGDAYLEFKATGLQVYHGIGLNTGADISNEASLDFAVVFTNGSIAELRQSGVYLGETRYATGDTFRVAIEGTRVRFYRNGSALALSTIAPVYPLRVGAAFSYLNGEISAATLTTGRPAATAARRGSFPTREGGRTSIGELALPQRRLIR